jgi:hypothetical protein
MRLTEKQMQIECGCVTSAIASWGYGEAIQEIMDNMSDKEIHFCFEYINSGTRLQKKYFLKSDPMKQKYGRR